MNLTNIELSEPVSVVLVALAKRNDDRDRLNQATLWLQERDYRRLPLLTIVYINTLLVQSSQTGRHRLVSHAQSNLTMVII